MMLRKLAVSLAVAGIISASNVHALGLGEIKVKSALNEPLDAEINLVQVSKLNPLQIQPRMADLDEFALAGLDKSRFLTDVSFQVKVNPDGSGKIYLRSNRPVQEPFLNFLVEVNWPNGRLVREYTLLLDPPVFDPTPVRKVVQSAAASPKKDSSTARSASAQSNSRGLASGKGQVYVDAKDTLWSIAVKYRANASVSAKKMMIALQKKNPHAFVDNNINGLRSGVVLELPSKEEIDRLDADEAALEVIRQTSAWKSRPSNVKPAVEASKKKPVAGASPEKPDSDPKNEKSGELKIVTPKDSIEPEEGIATDQAGDSGSEKKDATKPEELSKFEEQMDKPEPEASTEEVDAEKQALILRNQELEDRLSQSLENVDKINRENEELNQRLDSIQYELEKLREMLELKDNELAALQRQAAEAKAAPPPEKSFFDSITQSPGILGGIGLGLIAILGALFFFLRRGKKDEEELPEEAGLVQVPEDLTTPEPEEIEKASDSAAVAEAEVAALEEVDELEVGDEEDLLDDSELDLDLDEENDFEDLSDLDDLDDLDLDMDLDLEESGTTDGLAATAVEQSEDNESLVDDEFDLGLEDSASDVEDDDSLDVLLDEASTAEAVEESDALDDILGEAADEAELDGDELDNILAEDEIDLELDDQDLKFEVAEDETVEPGEDVINEKDDSENDLEFKVEMPDLSGESADDLGASTESEAGGSVDISAELEALVDASDSDSEEITSEIDENGLDDLLGSVSDEDIQALADAAEQDVSLGDLDSILDDAETTAQPETSSPEDDAIEALLAEDIDMPDSATEADGDVSDALEAMLAANPDPDSDPLPGRLESEDEINLEEIESDSDLDDLLAQVDEMTDQKKAAEDAAERAESDGAGDDLDAMLNDLDMDAPTVAGGAAVAAATAAAVVAPSEAAEDEIELEGEEAFEELEADLDLELNSLLDGSDDVAENVIDDEDLSVDEDFDELAGLNLLEGADEVETKLDLARAYMDMEDFDGATEILEEIVAEGNDTQKEEAQALIKSINAN